MATNPLSEITLNSLMEKFQLNGSVEDIRAKNIVVVVVSEEILT